MDRNVRVILNNKEVYGFQGQKILDLCAECGVEMIGVNAAAIERARTSARTVVMAHSR